MTRQRLLIFFVFWLAALFGSFDEAKAQCVLTRLQIDIMTATGGTTVTGSTGDSSTGAFSLNFGNVNGLGIGTPTAGVSKTSKTSSGMLYTTPITIRPIWTGVGCIGTATIKVYQDSTTSTASQDALREGSLAAGVATVPNSLASAVTITTNAANNTSYTRYVGIYVSNANGASRVAGTLSPKLIYQVSLP